MGILFVILGIMAISGLSYKDTSSFFDATIGIGFLAIGVSILMCSNWKIIKLIVDKIKNKW